MIALRYAAVLQRADLVRAGRNLETDAGLESVVTASLFTDARARPEDELHAAVDQRGWWGSAYLTPRRELGSRLWTLFRRGITASTPQRAATFARDALQWLLDDGVAADLASRAERWRHDGVLLTVDIQRPRKVASRWSRTWEVHLGV